MKTPWGNIKRTFFSPLCPRRQGEKWCLAGASLGNVSRNVEPLRFGRVSAELKSAKKRWHHQQREISSGLVLGCHGRVSSIPSCVLLPSARAPVVGQRNWTPTETRICYATSRRWSGGGNTVESPEALVFMRSMPSPLYQLYCASLLIGLVRVWRDMLVQLRQ